MSELSPEQAKKILDVDFANLVKKVRSGKTLTSAERALIKNKALGEPGDELPDIVEARTVVELAAALGVTRRTITNWRKLEGAPLPKPNGMHDVVAWREFRRKRELGDDAEDSEETLRYRKLLAEVEEREFRVLVRKGEYIARETVRQSWLQRAGRVTALMRSKLEKELPPLLVGLDAPAIQEKMSQAVDEFLSELHEQKENSLTP